MKITYIDAGYFKAIYYNNELGLEMSLMKIEDVLRNLWGKGCVSDLQVITLDSDLFYEKFCSKFPNRLTDIVNVKGELL